MDYVKKAWLNGLFFIVALVVNALGAFGLINGSSQKEVSDKYLTLITPDPSTFSIWSVIYLFLTLSIVFMIWKKEDAYYQAAINKISSLFIFSSILNMAWIIAFSFEQLVLSTIFILVFAVTLTLICLQLLKIQTGKHFLLPLTFGLYTGWLFIASVVNVAATLVKNEWNGFGLPTEVLASTTLIVAIVLVFGVLLRVNNAVFPIPIAWAFFGIYRFLISPEGFNDAYPMLKVVSLVGMAVLLTMSGLQLYKNHYWVIPKNYQA